MIVSAQSAGQWRALAIMLLVSAFFAVLLQPWLRPLSIFPYDFQRWIEAIALMMLAPMSMSFAMSFAKRYQNFFCLFVLLVVLVGAAAYLSSGPYFLVVALLRPMLWLVVAFGFLVAWSTADAKLRSFFSGTILLALACHLLYTAIGAITVIVQGVYDDSYVIFGFSNVNHAAGFYLVMLCLLPALSENLIYRQRAIRFLVFSSGAILSFLLIMIGSRGAFLAWIILALSCALFLRHSEVRRYFLWLLLAAVLALCAYASFMFAMSEMGIGAGGSGKSFASDSGRFMLYKAAWAGFLDAPWLGNGPLSYAALPDVAYGHAHNVFMTLLYEHGGVVTFSAACLWLFAVYGLFKRRNRIFVNATSLSGCAGLIAFSVHVQFSGLLMIPATVIAIILALAFVCSGFGFGKPEECSSSSIWSWKPVLLGGLLGVAYLVVVLQYWQSLDPATSQKPRFWLKGGTEVWFDSSPDQFNTR